MCLVRVTQMVSPKTGNAVANQFKIYTEEGVYFQSYESIIAFKNKGGQVFLDEYYWDYSRTTSKYRNEFLRENTNETRAKIKNGTYIFKNLNCGE